MSQNYVVNGDLRPWWAGLTVQQTLDADGVEGNWVAVALDGAVVPSSRWSETVVSPGSRLDIIQPCQGG